MSWIATAIGGGAVIGGIASYLGSSNAASAEENAAAQETATQQSIFNTENSEMAPYRTAGYGALSTLQGDMGKLTSPFTMQDFQTDPGYQFQLQQGEQAIQASAAARGVLNSTGTAKAMTNYSQGVANQQYQNAYGRYMQTNQNTYNMLSGVANMGLGAQGMTNSAAQNYGNNVNQAQISSGNAQAAADMAGPNALSSILGQGTNAYLMSNILSGKSATPYGTPGATPPGIVGGGSAGAPGYLSGDPAMSSGMPGMSYSSPLTGISLDDL